jgi:hypothetical protein
MSRSFSEQANHLDKEILAIARMSFDELKERKMDTINAEQRDNKHCLARFLVELSDSNISSVKMAQALVKLSSASGLGVHPGANYPGHSRGNSTCAFPVSHGEDKRRYSH